MDPPAQPNASRPAWPRDPAPSSSSSSSSNCCWPAAAPPEGGEEGNFLIHDSTQLLGVQAALILAYSAIILFGVAGNSLVLFATYRFRSLRTVTNVFIANLAVADLLVDTLCLPFTLAYTLYGEWKFGRALCFLLPCAQGLAVHVSTVTLSVIALDRHRSIVRHTRTKMSRDVCALVIAATWALSALLASPLAVFREYGTVQLAPGESFQVCAEKWPAGWGGGANGGVYSAAMLLLQYGLPLLVNCAAYARIWSKLQSSGLDQRHRRRRKTTKMLLTVVVVFAVSWLPFHAFQLAVDIDSSVLDMKDFKLLFTLFHIVAMCSTCVNPVLYGWMNANYRAAFLSVCYWPLAASGGRRCAKHRAADGAKGCADCKSTNV